MAYQFRKPVVSMQVLTRAGKTIVIDDRGNHAIGARRASSIYPSKDILNMTIGNQMNSASGRWSVRMVHRMSEGKPLYLEIIKPLDVVRLFLNSDEDSMVGIVDKVNVVDSIEGNKPVRYVQIVGRSLGAIWEYDLVKFFENAVGLTPEQQERNLDLQTAVIGLDFFNEPAYKAIIEIFKQMPMLEGSLPGGQTIRDYVQVGLELFSREGEKIFNTGLNSYSGTIFDFFKKYAGLPLNELWTDSKGGKLFLRMRPTPFSGPNDGEAARSQLGQKITSNWDSIRNWVDGKPHHVIPIRDERAVNIGRSHTRGYSVYSVVPGVRLVTKQSENASFPPIVDQDLVKELGTRDMSIRVEFLSFTKLDSGFETNKGTFEQMRFYRNKIYLWNRDNHNFFEGNITVKGDTDVRVGDKALREKDGRKYYVETVSHNYTFGAPFESTIGLSRGATDAERKVMYDEGLEFLRKMKADNV